jgi:hypothetical protein
MRKKSAVAEAGSILSSLGKPNGNTGPNYLNDAGIILPVSGGFELIRI